MNDESLKVTTTLRTSTTLLSHLDQKCLQLIANATSYSTALDLDGSQGVAVATDAPSEQTIFFQPEKVLFQIMVMSSSSAAWIEMSDLSQTGH